MFDPKRFTAPKAKPIPVVLLLDVSGSMSGTKIQNLNEAVKDMIETFQDTENNETEIHVAIITFGAEVKLHQEMVSAGEITWHDLHASGMTPLGTALKMAKAMIEDKNTIPSRAYRPAVVLVSDGQPNDQWQEPLSDFITNGRSAKCDRMALAIGADADREILGQFIVGTKNPLFEASDAKQLKDFFKFVTMSVSLRVQSVDKNIIPDAGIIDVKPVPYNSVIKKTDGYSSIKQSDQAVVDDDADDGYW